MPFTLVHPALILPLRRLPKHWFSLTGLVAGSMAPDFEKFAKMASLNQISHTWPSLLYFTLPVGLVISFIFHLWVRDPLLYHLPKSLKVRLLRFRKFSWLRHFTRHYLAVICSILIGGASHLLWDAFTHWSSPFAPWFPLLRMPFYIGGALIYGYVLVNLFTSLLGFIYLARIIMALPMKSTQYYDVPYASLFYWATAALLVLLIVGSKFLLVSNQGNIWDKLTTLTAAFLISLIITPLVLKVK